MGMKSLKKKIYQNVKSYYQERFGRKQRFSSCRTKINYAGRIYDEKELINLVGASALLIYQRYILFKNGENSKSISKNII